MGIIISLATPSNLSLRERREPTVTEPEVNQCDRFPARSSITARSARMGIGWVAGTDARPELPVGYLVAEAGPAAMSRTSCPVISGRDR